MALSPLTNISAFFKGARMCIGQHLAFAEITIVMAYMLRTFRMGMLPDSISGLFHYSAVALACDVCDFRV
ncbi:cytochrome P450 oxidoreductase [Penicillium canescens]|uniref:Cytochrome P450 oxidoreductase n=1 Tax=Penicillium canescens TaxID=5083 RepID=A0AAD6I4W2_PENCN|nr:cytochrome P450 oxidoreductase [Penicillium canescens]KAJ6030705.1 cytochrome P450 oxidoreductase [Penicillium canescens]KAJ6059580.1 cytochrome P450 oxidoreductase [Penicillium canescens]KAJ6077295.1 cytochrome P450 oxidoreductase [Penicillium canescens]